MKVYRYILNGVECASEKAAYAYRDEQIAKLQAQNEVSGGKQHSDILNWRGAPLCKELITDDYTAGRYAAEAALDNEQWDADCPDDASPAFRYGWDNGIRNWGNDGVADARRAEQAFGC
jgi:hypothetical protein